MIGDQAAWSRRTAEHVANSLVTPECKICIFAIISENFKNLDIPRIKLQVAQTGRTTYELRDMVRQWAWSPIIMAV